MVLGGMGQVINEEVHAVGGRAFRGLGSDEVSYWFPSEDAAKTALAAIDDRFKNATYNIEVNGEKEPQKGFSLSYGIGKDHAEADANLYLDKQRRLGTGERAERGTLPSSIHRVVSPGGQAVEIPVSRIPEEQVGGTDTTGTPAATEASNTGPEQNPVVLTPEQQKQIEVQDMLVAGR